MSSSPRPKNFAHLNLPVLFGLSGVPDGEIFGWVNVDLEWLDKTRKTQLSLGARFLDSLIEEWPSDKESIAKLLNEQADMLSVVETDSGGKLIRRLNFKPYSYRPVLKEGRDTFSFGDELESETISKLMLFFADNCLVPS